MKKYIVLLGIVLSSCSTMKIEEQIVQDFVKEKNLKNSSCVDCSYLIEEAGSGEKVLNYYQMAYQDKSLQIDKKRIDFVPHNFNNWTIDPKEIETIKTNLKKNDKTYYWNSKNFKSLDIPIIDKNELLLKIKNETLSISSTGYIVSKPILSLNKKHALIQYSGILAVGGISERYYLMEKEGDKWVIKLQLFDATY